MSQCKVFYEKWQMECCGATVKVGDLVEWFVCTKFYLPHRLNVGKVEYSYEAHSSYWEDLSVLNGKVKEIELLYVKCQEKEFFDEEENREVIDNEVIAQKLIKINKTYGLFEKEIEDLECIGYVVTMEDYTIRPAKEEEVSKEFLPEFDIIENYTESENDEEFFAQDDMEELEIEWEYEEDIENEEK